MATMYTKRHHYPRTINLKKLQAFDPCIHLLRDRLPSICPPPLSKFEGIPDYEIPMSLLKSDPHIQELDRLVAKTVVVRKIPVVKYYPATIYRLAYQKPIFSHDMPADDPEIIRSRYPNSKAAVGITPCTFPDIYPEVPYRIPK